MDEESGSVIGVVLGTQLVNQIEGVKGWGVPAEMIFEVSLLHLWKTIVYKLTKPRRRYHQMFSLPGLKLKSRA